MENHPPWGHFRADPATQTTFKRIGHDARIKPGHDVILEGCSDLLEELLRVQALGAVAYLEMHSRLCCR